MRDANPKGSAQMNNIYAAMGAVHAHAINEVKNLREGKMDAQTMVEYALIAALIAVALVGVVTVLGQQIGIKFNAVSQTLNSTNGNSIPAFTPAH